MYVPRGMPYIPRGTLREALAYPALSDAFADRAYAQALERVGLRRYVQSLDADRRWDRELSEDEQMALTLARVTLHAPLWVVFDDTFSSMQDDTLRRVAFGMRRSTSRARRSFTLGAMRTRTYRCSSACSISRNPGRGASEKQKRPTERTLRSA